MTECNYRSRLSAYHDGELAPQPARELERHIESCPACMAELAELRNISGLFAVFSEERMSRAALAGAHDAVEGDAQPSLLRIAGLLAGLAASAMVIGTAWLSETPAMPKPHHGPIAIVSPAPKDPQWLLVATTLRADPLPREVGDNRTQIVSEPAVADAAEWMLKNLGSGQ
jgi:anti-sigma factor RsiW